MMPPGAMGGGGRGGSSASAGVHFAPFQPDSEDHLRNFAVSAEERRQMEEDYRLGLAMQKGEAAAAAAASSGPGKLRGSPYRVCVCVCMCFVSVDRAVRDSSWLHRPNLPPTPTPDEYGF